MENRYVVLNENKMPIEPLTNGGRPLSEVEDFANLGILIPDGYVVVDFDTRAEADIVYNIIMAENTRCGLMRTPKGVHCWFKTPVEMKNSVKSRLAIGLRADFRSWGVKEGRPKLSYVRVKRDGEWCEWIKSPEEVGDFPFWLRPVKVDDAIFKDMGEGDGRNQALFNYILRLQDKHFSKEEIRKIITLINDHVFSDPLPESELRTILREESFKEETGEEGEFGRNFLTEKGEFKHDIFARALVSGMRIVSVNDVAYVYEGGVYKSVDREIERRMIVEYPIIKRAQRQEVLDYIKIITAVRSEDIPQQTYIINLRNTRLDVRTSTPLPFDPEVIDFSQLPVVYDPNASCPVLDRMLVKVFRGDEEVQRLFEEMVGYLLVKSCRYRKGFLFYGKGKNGKSTIINMLKSFLGEANYSDLPLHQLNDRFKTVELDKKLANLGDDIDPTLIKETGTIKKLFTGESVPVERKYEQGYKMRSYAKLIFSCNELPTLGDRSTGMYSRLMLVPFTATFSPSDSDFDPDIEDKITTPQALSHLLNLGLKGLQRLLKNNDFTEPQVVKDTNERYRVENSTVLSWMDDEGLEEEDLLVDTTERLYGRFSDWCLRSGITHIPSTRTFHRDIENTFGCTKKRVSNEQTGGLYRWRFVPNGTDTRSESVTPKVTKGT